MILKDLIEYACAKANLGKPGEVDAGVWAFAVSALNRCAEEIWKGWNWDNGKIIGLSIQTDEATITFPHFVEAVQAARIGTAPLAARDEILINQFEASRFEATGTPGEFLILPHAAAERQPAAAGTLSLASTSGLDIGVKVHVEGADGDGNRIAEVVTLSGPLAVSTVYSYAEITGLSKEASAGRVTVSEGDGTLLATIQPQDDRTALRRIRLMPDPGGTETTVHFICKRKFLRLCNNYDVFAIDRAESALIDMLVAELLEYDQRADAAMAYRQSAGAKLGEAVRFETESMAREMRVIPAQPEFTPESEE